MANDGQCMNVTEDELFDSLIVFNQSFMTLPIIGPWLYDIMTWMFLWMFHGVMCFDLRQFLDVFL